MTDPVLSGMTHDELSLAMLHNAATIIGDTAAGCRSSLEVRQAHAVLLLEAERRLNEYAVDILEPIEPMDPLGDIDLPGAVNRLTGRSTDHTV